MSHSKRNTSRPIFTSHERAQAKAAWGSSTARLTRDSYLAFGSCNLCLEPARDPVSCDGGGTGDDHDHHHQGQGQGQGGNGSGAGKAHLFCRECLLANLLAQRTEIKRQRAQQEREAAEAAEEAARRAEEDRRRVVAEFELTQAGLAVGKGGERRPEESKEDQGSSITTASGQTEGSKLLEAGNSSKKRKLEIDESVVSKIARADQEKARRAIEAEKAAVPSLPSFWSPSVSTRVDPKATVKKPDTIRSTTICPASDPDAPHGATLKTMVTVSFTEEEADRKDDDGRDRRRLRRICPLCRKELTNASGGMLARRCGHVVCKGCAGRFLGGADRDAHSHAAAHGERESVRCLVCNEELSGEGRKRSKDKDKGGGSGNGTAEGEKAAKPPLPWHGLIEIQSGGTGFSSAGQSEVKKTMTTFQC